MYSILKNILSHFHNSQTTNTLFPKKHNHNTIQHHNPQKPSIPKLKKGTECIKLLLSQTSKEMHAPPNPMLFPIFECTRKQFSIPIS